MGMGILILGIVAMNKYEKFKANLAYFKKIMLNEFYREIDVKSFFLSRGWFRRRQALKALRYGLLALDRVEHIIDEIDKGDL